MTCPDCDSTGIDVLYTDPLLYQCRVCGVRLRDANARALEVLVGAEARTKRPEMYGEPVCACCSHAPHPNGPCRWCSKEQPHPVRLVRDEA